MNASISTLIATITFTALSLFSLTSCEGVFGTGGGGNGPVEEGQFAPCDPRVEACPIALQECNARPANRIATDGTAWDFFVSPNDGAVLYFSEYEATDFFFQCSEPEPVNWPGFHEPLECGRLYLFNKEAWGWEENNLPRVMRDDDLFLYWFCSRGESERMYEEHRGVSGPNGGGGWDIDIEIPLPEGGDLDD